MSWKIAGIVLIVVCSFLLIGMCFWMYASVVVQEELDQCNVDYWEYVDASEEYWDALDDYCLLTPSNELC